MSKRVGILTGGGDCCGLNPAIRGAVYRAYDFHYEVFGIRDGWKGLIEGNIFKIHLQDAEELIDKAGTFLGTSRTNPFKLETGIEKVLSTIKNYGLDAILAMGGEDTLGVARKLFEEYRVNVVGAPKTMDNDLSSTDFTFGFDSDVPGCRSNEKYGGYGEISLQSNDIGSNGKACGVGCPLYRTGMWS